MSIKKKAVRGVFWSALESWGSRTISMAVFFLLARLLGPETFGLVALAGVFLSFVQIFLDQGFSQAIVQRENLEDDHLNTAFWTNILIGFILTIISIACASWTASLFNEDSLGPILRWLSISFLLSSLSSVQQAILQRKLAFKSLAIRSLVAVAVSGIIGISMAFLGFGVWSLVGQQLSNRFVQALVLWKSSNWRPNASFSIQHFRDLFAFGSNIMLISFLNFFNRRSDDFLIGFFLGPIALGYYTVAYRIILLLTELITRTTEKVAMPIFSRLQGDPNSLKNAFYKVTEVTSLLSFPIFLSIAILSPEIIEIVFGNEWSPSIPVLQVLSFIGIVHSISFFNGTVLVATGRPSWKLKFNFVNALANVISFLLVVKWGILAVATAYTVRGLLALPISVFLAHKAIKLDLGRYASNYIPPTVSSVAMVALIYYLKNTLQPEVNIYLLTVLCLVSGYLFYLLVLLVLKPNLIKVGIKIFN